MNYSRDQLMGLSPDTLAEIIILLDGAVCGVARNLTNLVHKLPDVQTGDEASALLKDTMTATAMVIQSADQFIALKIDPSPNTMN